MTRPTPLIPERLETSRLTLRMFEETDWDALFEMFRDPECVRFTIGAPLNRWQTWRTLAAYIGHWQLRGYGPYAVVDRSTATTMGAVGLWFPGEWPEPEIKWSFARRFWGHGFAAEAATAVRDMVAKHLGWSRLVSVVLPQNERSKSVARRLGGHLEKTIPFRDGVADMFVYDLSAECQIVRTTRPSRVVDGGGRMIGDGWSIREATAGDAVALALLGEETFREAFGPPVNEAADVDGYCAAAFVPEQVARELGDGAFLTLVVEAGGRLIAYGQLCRGSGGEAGGASERGIELKRFYVRREWYGRGVAQGLMGRLMEAAAAGGFEAVWLAVWERNPRARRFYEKCGFREVGEQMFQLGRDLQRDLVLARPVGAAGDRR